MSDVKPYTEAEIEKARVDVKHEAFAPFIEEASEFPTHTTLRWLATLDSLRAQLAAARRRRREATMRDGGPAFPFPGWNHPQDSRGNIPPDTGMTLRDWFAAAALTGLCAGDFEPRDHDTPFDRAYAEQAYDLADAMLAARDDAKGGG